MSFKRKQNHNDKNHVAICFELRRRGVEVVEIYDPLDTVCHYQDHAMLIEIKPEGQATYTKKQLTFMSDVKHMPVAIAKTADEAFTMLSTKDKGLSTKQKDALAGFLLKNDKEKYHHQIIEKVLETD